MNFQITLLLTSFVYLDVITQQIPAVQSVYDTPMILLFFVIVLVMQVVLIVGRFLQIKRYFANDEAHCKPLTFLNNAESRTYSNADREVLS